MKNKKLYEALVSFPLAETGGRYTFLHRLCRENNWSRAEGLRAIAEYKRFLYLSQVSAVPVTPPVAVDQVWHLHLLYTRSYWEDLCQGVFGRPLHHGPTKGGTEEDEKFDDWYGRTRGLYEAEFLASPPPGLWPARFTPEKRYRWTDLTRNWVVPKPVFSGLMPGLAPALLLHGALPVVVTVIAVGVIIAVIASAVDTAPGRKKSEGGDGCGGFGCSSGDSGSCGDAGGGDCGGGGCGGGCGGGD